MKKSRLYLSLFTITLVFMSAKLSAGELVFTFNNPSFGGSPLNGNWMLSQAQAQSTFTEGRVDSRLSRDPLEDFKESLNRQILSRLSRQLISNTFGEASLEEGRYELGDFVIDIVPSAEGVNITILDLSTGGETNILVPYF